MKKVFLIGFKDLTLTFRDRPALMLMLLAPFLLTLGLGFVTGRFSGGAAGLSDIPVILVNQDKAQLGDALVGVFKSADLADLIEASESDDPLAARRSIDEDQAAALVIIPAGFSESVLAQSNGTQAEAVKIEIYTNPTRPTSAGIVQTIVEGFLGRVETGRVAGQVAVTQLVIHGLIDPDEAGQVGAQLGQGAANLTPLIRLKTAEQGEAPVEFDILAYLAPAMALMFLMYAVSYGGRSILAEHSQGTLPRLMVSPTSSTQVLGGKVLGVYLTGVAQLGVLILASTLLFGLKWGDELGVSILVLAAVFGATGWGMLLTSLARTPAQVGSLGSALMLMFGILGGSFISLENMPPFVQTISKITPNAWGLDGFTTLALGGNLSDIGLPVAALLVMGALLFALAVIVFNRQGLVQ
jgi:ABC-2 type transport system permease protein